MRKVAVFGMGYVGCVSAACLSRDGHHVVGVDIDPDKVTAVQGGQSPVVEPGLDKLVSRAVATGRLSATINVEQAVRETQIGLITVGTPSTDDGAVSTRAVARVVRAVGQVLRQTSRDYTLVVRSTLLPGILEEQLAPILAESAQRELGSGLHLCNNPEFLRESTAILDYDNPPFVVVGTVDGCNGQSVLDLYRGVQAEQIVTDSRTAAMLKYACNAFHALKIDFANEIGALSRALDADGQKVMELVCCDKHLNISPAYLRPGFAFGGSCLPKDVRALTRFAQQKAIRTELLSAILPSNEAHLKRALQIIYEAGQKRIGLVGLTFKAGTDDLRESPMVILAETLLGRGYDLKIFDPGLTLRQLVGANLSYIDLHLPHLARLLVDGVVELFAHADVLVLGSDVANEVPWQMTYTGEVIDLRRDLVVGRTEPVAIR